MILSIIHSHLLLLFCRFHARSQHAYHQPTIKTRSYYSSSFRKLQCRKPLNMSRITGSSWRWWYDSGKNDWSKTLVWWYAHCKTFWTRKSDRHHLSHYWSPKSISWHSIMVYIQTDNYRWTHSFLVTSWTSCQLPALFDARNKFWWLLTKW